MTDFYVTHTGGKVRYLRVDGPPTPARRVPVTPVDAYGTPTGQSSRTITTRALTDGWRLHTPPGR